MQCKNQQNDQRDKKEDEVNRPNKKEGNGSLKERKQKKNTSIIISYQLSSHVKVVLALYDHRAMKEYK
jgi:hypothetical protein